MNEQQEAEERRNASRGERAEQLLRHELLQGAFAAATDAAWQEFITADPKDQQALYLARLKYEAVKSVILQLDTHIKTGQLARNRLQQWAAKLRKQSK